MQSRSHRLCERALTGSARNFRAQRLPSGGVSSGQRNILLFGEDTLATLLPLDSPAGPLGPLVRLPGNQHSANMGPVATAFPRLLQCPFSYQGKRGQPACPGPRCGGHALVVRRTSHHRTAPGLFFGIIRTAAAPFGRATVPQSCSSEAEGAVSHTPPVLYRRSPRVSQESIPVAYGIDAKYHTQDLSYLAFSLCI